MSPKVKILFLCTGNSCRSQMAEAWAKELRSDAVEAWSGGVAPKGLDPLAVKVMAEIRIDMSGQVSKHVNTLLDIPFDYVITLCGHAQETCPFFPGKTKRIHQGFDDPSTLAERALSEEETLEHYRRIRDEIRGFVEKLPDNILE
ncbi:arsenate reductase ArsC [bacterium]|nr:arsenate reductase ArsC [bacterium]